MRNKTKKTIKIFATMTCFEAIAGFIVVIALIAGVMAIISKTGYNLYLSIPACIVFVFMELPYGVKAFRDSPSPVPPLKLPEYFAQGSSVVASKGRSTA